MLDESKLIKAPPNSCKITFSFPFFLPPPLVFCFPWLLHVPGRLTGSCNPGGKSQAAPDNGSIAAGKGSRWGGNGAGAAQKDPRQEEEEEEQGGIVQKSLEKGWIQAGFSDSWAWQQQQQCWVIN